MRCIIVLSTPVFFFEYVCENTRAQGVYIYRQRALCHFETRNINTNALLCIECFYGTLFVAREELSVGPYVLATGTVHTHVWRIYGASPVAMAGSCNINFCKSR